MKHNRGHLERTAGKVIDWLARKLTPNTFYWTGRDNPFAVIENERNEEMGIVAVEHLARIVWKADMEKAEGTVRQLRIDGENTGDWYVLVSNTGPAISETGCNEATREEN